MPVDLNLTGRLKAPDLRREHRPREAGAKGENVVALRRLVVSCFLVFLFRLTAKGATEDADQSHVRTSTSVSENRPRSRAGIKCRKCNSRLLPSIRLRNGPPTEEGRRKNRGYYSPTLFCFFLFSFFFFIFLLHFLISPSTWAPQSTDGARQDMSRSRNMNEDIGKCSLRLFNGHTHSVRVTPALFYLFYAQA